jgi:hypothetical protein
MQSLQTQQNAFLNPVTFPNYTTPVKYNSTKRNFCQYKINKKYFIYSLSDGQRIEDDNSVILPSNSNLIKECNNVVNFKFPETKSYNLLQNDKDIGEIASNNQAGVITQIPPNSKMRNTILNYGKIQPGNIDYTNNNTQPLNSLFGTLNSSPKILSN